MSKYLKAALVIALLLNGCDEITSSKQSEDWSQASIQAEFAGCEHSFIASNPNLEKAHAETYCNCVIPKLTSRFSPQVVQKNPQSSVAALRADGSMDKCLREALAINDVNMSDETAVQDLAERISSKFADKCKVILKDDNPNSMDREVCDCAAAGGITPEKNPKEFRSALTACTKQRLGAE